MQSIEFYFSLVPALGAIVLSLYNWYSLRQGGKIKPLKIVNYGLWSVKINQRQVKHLFLPVILDNVAVKPALVTDISISFNYNGSKTDLAVNRRIELTMPPGPMSGMGINQFRMNQTKEIVPFYPIPVNGLEGRMVMLDCLDRGNVLELDKDYSCIIEVTFGNNKISSIIFPFKVTSDNFEKALDHIQWYRA